MVRLFCVLRIRYDFLKGEKIIITYHDQKLVPTPEETKGIIENSLDLDKAEDIVCVDLSDDCALADYMIIASGTSSRHVSALARKLKERLHLKHIDEVHIEGLEQCDWVVLDAGDVIVHLFRPEVREFYNIERMWCADPIFNVVPTTDSHISA